MSLCNYGCAALTDQELISCNNWKKGGINAWAFIDCSFSFTDITAAAEWNSGINAGSIFIFKKVAAEIPLESPDFVPSPVGCEEDIRAGATFNATIYDSNVTPANALNYPALNERQGYVVFFNCEEELIYYQFTNTVRFDVKGPMIPRSNKEFQMFQIDLAWRNASLLISNAPDGIFTT